MSRESRLERILKRPETWAEPPAEVETALLDAIAHSRQAGRGLTVPRRLWGLAGLLTAAVAAVVLFFAFSPDASEEGRYFDVAATALAPDVEGTLGVGPAEAGWWLRLEMTGLPAAPDDSYYQGWVSGPAGEVSVGTFHMRGGDLVTLWSGVDLNEYSSFRVTLQQTDGGHDPSDSVMLTSELSDLDT